MTSTTDPVLVVIPARYKSSRFPGKPLVRIAGVPMIVRVLRAAAEAVGVEFVVVATDDGRIAEVVNGEGFRAIMTSPSHQTGTDRVAEATRGLGWRGLVVNVQGDEPLLEPEAIAAVVEGHRASDWAPVTNACTPLLHTESPEDRNIPKVVNAGDRLVYISRAGIPGSKSDTPHEFLKQVCIYVFDSDALHAHFGLGKPRGSIEAREDIEILRLLEAGVDVRMVELASASKAVDIPDDVRDVEMILRSRDAP